ncbi:choice-of-anchor B family protein [Paucibacter sp. B2R-40]|uniref:LVIVD repeat-containing protein n=1 Tax=Paucibacter sp. B2R-40 TaxID=2893554 RepID=UPI0021E4175E|nr:choice-of-anchor B family protein [Paucibacter sp. B2R-40]MCV2354597.1 choice-of-anchor B family protein [Paucibacter sp. B2R-40]
MQINPVRVRAGLYAVMLSFTLALSACGGGGSSSNESASPAPTPAVAQGGKLVGSVARDGVAGTWGYTAPDGNRYAIMGTAKGVLVLDLRDPAQPRVVDEVDGPTDTRHPGIYWREMRVYGSHAYIVSEHSNVRGGIMILDLSGLPNAVRYVKSVTPHDGELAAHTVDIDTARGLLYLQRETDLAAPTGATPTESAPTAKVSAGASDMRRTLSAAAKPSHPVGDVGHGSVEIWDIKTDPENPRYLNTFNQGRSIHDMTAVGDYCYVAEGNESSFSIWDVKDPQAPKMVVRWQVGAGHFAHNIWPSGDGRIVVTTEELPNGLPARVWRLNGNAQPTPLSSFQLGDATPHNVIMEGDLAYLSHYTAGAAVFDLKDPAAPKQLLQVDTNPNSGPGLIGCWGVYKFPGQPWMICSDINEGFKLIQIGSP